MRHGIQKIGAIHFQRGIEIEGLDRTVLERCEDIALSDTAIGWQDRREHDFNGQ